MLENHPAGGVCFQSVKSEVGRFGSYGHDVDVLRPIRSVFFLKEYKMLQRMWIFRRRRRRSRRKMLSR